MDVVVLDGPAGEGEVKSRRSSRATAASPISLSSQSHGQRSDRRYHTKRWRKLAHYVLRRDAYVCRVSSACPTPATVADHVVEVYPGMPDALFYDPTNLRASCSRHNTARGIAARLERETRSDRPTSVVTRDYTRR